MGTNPDLSPIFGIRGDLPPAMVLTVEYDVLRDEGIQYAKRLEESGVQTEWKHYANAFHGQCNMPFSSLRREMIRDIVAYLSTHM
uniref:Abhydrolase_3 domain-containing protein n=1 Tax=Heterorhabditis bacteriophora TaxID=37862 RepID=A0A1I7X5D0_HETBA